MTRRNFIALSLFVSALAPAAYAADLVDLNTADLATLETLPGVGATLAQRIIDARPFASTADISRVQGIGGPGSSSYDKLQGLITVSGGTQPPATQPQTDSSQTQTQAQTTTQTLGSSLPLITAHIATDAAAVAGAGTVFDGSVADAQGKPLSDARYLWNFGDGGVAEGAHAVHTFAYPGTYEVTLSIGYNYSSATARLTLDVAATNVSLVAEGDGSLTLYNYAASDLEVGWWSLGQGSSTPFFIPAGTVVLAGKGVRFAPVVLGFAGDQNAKLYYPNGTVAAAAVVGQNSPLRGQVVSAPKAATSASAPAQSPSKKSSDLLSGAKAAPAGQTFSQDSAPTLNSSNQAAAFGALNPNAVEWTYLLALAAVVAVGAAGAYYAYPAVAKQEETYGEADEFEIEE